MNSLPNFPFIYNSNKFLALFTVTVKRSAIFKKFTLSDNNIAVLSRVISRGYSRYLSSGVELSAPG